MSTSMSDDALSGIPMQDDALLSPAEAAAESGYSIDTIRCAYRSGELRAYQPTKNGRVKIPRSALMDWLRRPASRCDQGAVQDRTVVPSDRRAS